MIFQKENRLKGNKYNHPLQGQALSGYLGLTISSDNFDLVMTALVDKAHKTNHALRRSLYRFNSQARLRLKNVFNSIIKPVLSYGSQIWGIKYQNSYDSWDKSSTEFCKNLGVHRTAPNLACRAEVGRFLLSTHKHKRAFKF